MTPIFLASRIVLTGYTETIVQGNTITITNGKWLKVSPTFTVHILFDSEDANDLKMVIWGLFGGNGPLLLRPLTE